MSAPGHNVYLTWEHGRLILLLLALLWLAERYGVPTWLWSALKSAVGPVLRKPILLLKARWAESAGDCRGAAASYEEAGALAQALDCFEKAEDYHRCGELCLQMGRSDYAAEGFVLSGEKRRAAALFEEKEMYGRAAETYLAAGNGLHAAAAFAKAGQHLRAAETYAESGDHVRAGKAFEQAGQYERAAESLEQEVAEAGGLQDIYLAATERARLARLAVAAARCFEKAGKPERAARILEVTGQYGHAASLLEQLGHCRKAAELYEKAGDAKKTAELLARAGEALSPISANSEPRSGPRRPAFRIPPRPHSNRGETRLPSIRSAPRLATTRRGWRGAAAGKVTATWSKACSVEEGWAQCTEPTTASSRAA